MATKKTSGTTERAERPETNDLAQFLALLRTFPDAAAKGMLAQAKDDDERRIIASLGSVLNDQIGALCDYIAQHASGTAARAQSEIATYMQLSRGVRLVQEGIALSQDLSSPTAKLSLSDIFHIIKKIISALSDFLPIKIPFLPKLLDLLDELFNSKLATGQPNIASTLMQRNALAQAELVQVARLERESAWRFVNTDEDN